MVLMCAAILVEWQFRILPPVGLTWYILLCRHWIDVLLSVCCHVVLLSSCTVFLVQIRPDTANMRQQHSQFLLLLVLWRWLSLSRAFHPQNLNLIKDNLISAMTTVKPRTRRAESDDMISMTTSNHLGEILKPTWSHKKSLFVRLIQTNLYELSHPEMYHF